jgi:hypothetical protein
VFSLVQYTKDFPLWESQTHMYRPQISFIRKPYAHFFFFVSRKWKKKRLCTQPLFTTTGDDRPHVHAQSEYWTLRVNNMCVFICCCLPMTTDLMSTCSLNKRPHPNCSKLHAWHQNCREPRVNPNSLVPPQDLTLQAAAVSLLTWCGLRNFSSFNRLHLAQENWNAREAASPLVNL